MYIDQTMGNITGISTLTNLGKKGGGGKGKQYKFPPLPKLVKGDKSLKFLTEQKLLIKYHQILQLNKYCLVHTTNTTAKQILPGSH